MPTNDSSFSLSRLLVASLSLATVAPLLAAPADIDPAEMVNPEDNPQPQSVLTENFHLPEGYEITVWASTPELFNPTNMDIDAEGRIWVAEGVNYRRHKGRRPEGDRIVVLEDTDGDGKADSSHTFVQEEGLIAPLGVGVFDNQIYVSQPPHLLRYTDVDRNLRFDPAVDKREELLTGFNAINHDHSLHSVSAGPDGKLYFNNGNCGAVFTDNSGKTFRMGNPYKSGGGNFPIDHIAIAGHPSDDGHVWMAGFTARMDPDANDVEIVGHGYRNSYEQAVNSLGDMFQNDNDDPPACRVSYILPYGCAGYFTRDAKRYYRSVRRPGQSHARAHWRQDDPGTMDAGDIYGGGSPTGVLFYENGAMGPDFVGTLLSAEPGRNMIFSYQPKPKGATYTLDREVFVTTNTSNQYYGSDFVGGGEAPEEVYNFRPSDLAVGPDGAIYIADWYDPRVGGHRDLDNTCSGTIYRIAPKGFKPEVPKLQLDTVEGALDALRSPALSARWMGQGALRKFGPEALAGVEALIQDPNPYIAARGIWLLPELGENGVEAAQKLLTSEKTWQRLVALRALGRSGKVDLITLAQQLAQDPDPGVRRDVALLLRDQPAEKTSPILLTLAKQLDLEDKNALEAIGLAAANQEEEIWTALAAELAGDDPLQWDPLMARLTWRLWPEAAVPALEKRAAATSLPLEERLFALESLAFIRSAKAAQATLRLAEIPELKKAAQDWLLRNNIGEWEDYGVAEALKERDIFNPETVAIQPVQVPEAPEPSFTVEEALALEGNAKRGKMVAQRCVMCHQIEGNGVEYGPNLKGWGSGQPREVIARAIIDPSFDVAHGYEGHQFTLREGGLLEGILLTNSKDLYQVLSTGGLAQYVPKSRTKKVAKKEKSLMLSADQLGLTPQDVADLVEYLRHY